VIGTYLPNKNIINVVEILYSLEFEIGKVAPD
jgi:hypothetical protein